MSCQLVEFVVAKWTGVRYYYPTTFLNHIMRFDAFCGVFWATNNY